MDEKEEKAVIAYPLDCMTCFNCELECDPGAVYVSPERAKDIVLPW
jgi:NAD-dependent dihydropyrimidine dehydrogenase PreA subunit